MVCQCLADLGLPCRAKPCRWCFIPLWVEITLTSVRVQQKYRAAWGRWVASLAGTGDTRRVIQCPALWVIPETTGTACPTAAPYLAVSSEAWLQSVKHVLTSPLGTLRDPVRFCVPQLLMDPSVYHMLPAPVLCLIRLLVQTYPCPLEELVSQAALWFAW